MTNDEAKINDDKIESLPVIQGGWPSTPQGGSISPANTSPYNMKYGWKYT